jgi:putative MATE family efflux protein
MSGSVIDEPMDGQILSLVWPVLIEQFLLYLVGLSDTILTGRLLGVSDLAAVTVCSYLSWFLGSMMIIVSAGATAVVARLVGSGDRRGAERVTGQALLVAGAVGLGLCLLGELLAPAVIAAMNLRDESAQAAVGFLRILLLAKPSQAMQAVGVACLRGSGDTRTGMQVMGLVNVINLALSAAAATGSIGLPRMGLYGIALGTATGETVGGLLVLAALRHGRAGLRITRLPHRFLPDDLARMARISLPAFAETLTNSVCQLWFVSLINGLGKTATAAHGVAIRCESLAFLTVVAFGVAASTLTGQYLGAGRPDLARRAARTCWLLGLLYLTLAGAVLYLGADPMFRLFVGPEQAGVAEVGVPVLRLVAFALPALATITVLSGALRGAGDTHWPWFIVLAGYMLVRLPLTRLAIGDKASGGLGLGLMGAWIAMFLDLGVRSLALMVRFFQGGWVRTRV